MGRATRTPKPKPVELPPAAELRRIKISPEVAHYLITRGIPLPTCPPKIKTPEPRRVAGARFDPTAVDRVVRALSLLKHTQGEWAGRSLRPDPWQVAYIVAPVFGWVRKNEHGDYVRIIRKLYVDIPRKNGKTTIAGGFAIYLTAADGEEGAQVYAVAASERQAGYCFDPVKQLVTKATALKGHLKPYAKRIVHPRSGSYFAVVSSAADLIHGANVHGAVVDELHVHKTADTLEAVETGTGSRRQPLVVVITTADDGKPGTVYARRRGYIERLAKHIITDPASYGVVWAADPKDDPFDERTWAKANPGYGISPTREFMVSAAAEARQSPADLAKFLRLHLGIRTKQVTRYINLPVWDLSAGRPIDREELEGRPCYAGLDLAAVSDFNALCLTFPDDDGGYDAIWRFWLPDGARADLEKRTAGESEVWIQQGLVTVTSGAVVDYDVIAADIIRDAVDFDIRTLGYDRRFFANVIAQLQENGVECVAVPQTYNEMTAPTKELLRLLMAKKYRHGGNPVMRWMVDNLAVEQKPDVGLKPDKANSGDKIDGVTAAVTALREVLYDQTPDERSIYEDHDLETG